MGVQLLSYLQLGKETVKGTAVAATRRMDPGLDSAFQVDFMQNFHEGRAAGRRNPISYATSMGTMVTINYQTDAYGIAYNQLHTFFQFPDGGTAVGVGTAVWTHNYGGTAAGSFVTYTAEYGDNVQEYEAEYVFAKDWTLSADVGGMTQLSATLVGRQSTKSTKTSLNSVDPVRIPSYLWQWKHAATQAGIGGASFESGQLKSFSLQMATGLTEGKFLDGQPYFTQALETLPANGQLHLVVNHDASAVSELYDKAAAGTPTFFQLSAAGPTLYAATVTGCWIPEKVQPLSGVIDGMTMLDVTGPIVYDDTWGKALQTVVTNSIITYM